MASRRFSQGGLQCGGLPRERRHGPARLSRPKFEVPNIGRPIAELMGRAA
jgi:hypothetical protein